MYSLPKISDMKTYFETVSKGVGRKPSTSSLSSISSNDSPAIKRKRINSDEEVVKKELKVKSEADDEELKVKTETDDDVIFVGVKDEVINID